jgi:hypothetical protein
MSTSDGAGAPARRRGAEGDQLEEQQPRGAREQDVRAERGAIASKEGSRNIASRWGRIASVDSEELL